MFTTVKYRPDYPRKPFTSKDESCQWMASLVDWYSYQHRHSGIKFGCLSDVTALKRWRSAATALSCTNRLASSIRGIGHDQPGTGINRRWPGSISRLMSSMHHGSYR
jgi:hypothetical protein